MKFTLIVLFALFAVAISGEITWEQFKERHNKVYSKYEEAVRRNIYNRNVQKIEKHNKKFEAGKSTFKLAVNEFADMDADEFAARFNGYRGTRSVQRNVHNMTGALPKSVDWRKKNVVTEVKNQEQCGSCWAFSAVCALESAHAIATGKLVSLSEQQLVDCSTPEGNQGCNGGLMDAAYDYVKKYGGLDTEASYSYTAQDGKCHATKKDIAATLKSYVDIPANDEKALADAVATKGPVAVAIDATFFLQLYGGGILQDPMCNDKELNHGVTVVGYDTEGSKDYWIVKNSWGESWGEQGYFKMARGKNQCGVAAQATYPVV